MADQQPAEEQPAQRPPAKEEEQKTPEQRDRDALQRAIEEDRANPPGAIMALQQEIRELRAVAQQFQTMRGDYPIKVTGNVISIGEDVGGERESFGLFPLEVCVNGAPATIRYLGLPAV